MSRHYNDLHCLLSSEVGKSALTDRDLGVGCVRHARMFFGRPDHDLASAAPGSFALAPIDGMVEVLSRDYANTTAMIFGAAPEFSDILASTFQLEQAMNGHD